MNYIHIYNDLITSRLLLQEERAVLKKQKQSYFERHHIIPKCMGGSNDKDNLILLTAKEHYIAHWLLWKGHGLPKLAQAFNMMLVKANENRISCNLIKSSKTYERLRIEINSHISETIKEFRKNNVHPSSLLKGETHWNYGRKHSEETKKKLSLLTSGENHWAYGTNLSEQTKEKQRETMTGRTLSPEHKEKVVKGLAAARKALENKDRTTWKINRQTAEIWKIADKIYDEWVKDNCPGSRKLGHIINDLSKIYDIKTPSRNETMLKYFRTFGNPLDDVEWVNHFKS